MFYATMNTRECSKKTECEQLGHIDLHRFSTEEKRDRFVSGSKFARKISPITASKRFPDQFKYWSREK